MSYTVLIVEDEFLLANMLVSYTESLGHAVVGIAENGRKAIEMAESLRPDIILMDIQLPEIDGITAAHAITQTYDVPIIIISAFSDRNFVDGAASAGVMSYLIKPVSSGDLQAVIETTMARFHEMVELRHEVGDLKQSMVTRKLVERAKGILMKKTGMSEDEAFRKLQQISQQKNRPMVEVAEAVITTSEIWQ